MAKRSEKDVRAEQIADVQYVMGDERGRRFILRVLEDICCVKKSVTRSQVNVLDAERLVYNAAKQDVGHWLRDEAELAHPVGFGLMWNEANIRKAMDAREDKPKEKMHGE